MHVPPHAGKSHHKHGLLADTRHCPQMATAKESGNTPKLVSRPRPQSASLLRDRHAASQRPQRPSTALLRDKGQFSGRASDFVRQSMREDVCGVGGGDRRENRPPQLNGQNIVGERVEYVPVDRTRVCWAGIVNWFRVHVTAHATLSSELIPAKCAEGFMHCMQALTPRLTRTSTGAWLAQRPQTGESI